MSNEHTMIQPNPSIISNRSKAALKVDTFSANIQNRMKNIAYHKENNPKVSYNQS